MSNVGRIEFTSNENIQDSSLGVDNSRNWDMDREIKQI